MEVILALIIFSIAVLKLAQTLQESIRVGAIIHRENEIRISLRSFLEEVRRKPLAELTQTFADERLGVTFQSTAEPLNLTDRNGTVLSDLYRLQVVASYEAASEEYAETLEVYVYKTQSSGR